MWQESEESSRPLSKLSALLEFQVEKILYVNKVFNFAILQVAKLNW